MIRPADDPFGVYIHWPFCAQKCPYCDFNSHVRMGGWDEAQFLSAYLRELDHAHALTGKREVHSIFFGGGTPSLMQPDTVAAILDHIARLWPVAGDAEITLEANPGSVEAKRFRGYRAAGINRVSMGLQSLRDDDLKRLGRIHTVEEAKAALKIARETFARFSFDLIYARPGQTADAWRGELAEALSLAGDHISLYQLTIEPDTPYAALHASGKLIVPDEDAALALYEITQEMTAARGLNAYEISNHAAPGQESRHNLLYWRYGAYAGIGPGAHGRLLVGEARVATVAERHPETWAERVAQRGHGWTEETALSRAEQVDEALLMGLRLREGVSLARLDALGGLTPAKSSIDGLVGLGLLEILAAPTAPSAAQSEVHKASPAGNWRANELEPILACAGPGLAPDGVDGAKAHAKTQAKVAPGPRIRATPKGRFVLNAVVAELSRALTATDRVDKARGAH